MYTHLYWYYPWLEHTVFSDFKKRKIYSKYDEYNEYDQNITTLNTAAVEAEVTTHFNDLYFSYDSAYENLPMGPNPNNAPAYPSGRFRTIVIQISLFLTAIYEKCIILS